MVWSVPEPALNLSTSLLAIEAQAFSLRVPECFFSMYSPVRSDGTARADRDRLMEDIRFVAKSVRPLLSLSFHSFFAHVALTPGVALDRKRVHHAKRISLHPILRPRRPRAPRCAPPAREHAPGSGDGEGGGGGAPTA